MLYHIMYPISDFLPNLIELLENSPRPISAIHGLALADLIWVKESYQQTLFSILLAWNHLQINDDKLVEHLCLIPCNRTVTGRGTSCDTKQRKQVTRFGQFLTFLRHRDHLVVAKTYLVIPPTFCFQERQTGWLTGSPRDLSTLFSFCLTCFTSVPRQE